MYTIKEIIILILFCCMQLNVSGLSQAKANPIIHYQGPNNAHGGGIKKITKKGEY